MAVNLGSFVDKNNLKTIWTKVVNKIKSEINNIDIGGRNYIIYGRITSYEPYNVVNGRSINYIKTTWKSSYTGNIFTIKVDGFIPSKGIWTVSGRIKVNGSIPTTKYFTSSASTHGSLVTKCDYDTTTGRFVITQTYPGNSDWILHCPTTRSSGSSDVVELFDLKFEKGNKATDWSLSPEDLDNNISLIRPNLLSGTKDWTYGKRDGTIQSDKYYNLSVLYYKNTSSASYVDIAVWSGLSVKASTEYTLSFYAKGSGKIISYFHPNNVEIGYSNKGITTREQDGSIRHVLTSGWEKYVITWKTLSTISGNKTVLPVRIYRDTEVWVCGVKFEEGNGATAWCESSSETAIPKYSVATTTSNGLMSSNDKSKLDMFGNGYVTAGFVPEPGFTDTLGECVTCEGFNTTASGNCSHAEGLETKATGNWSHAEGRGTNATGNFSHSEGSGTKAIGVCSHAEGLYTKAIGYCSHASGEDNEAEYDYQTVIGRRNKTGVPVSYFTIGNGSPTGPTEPRSNAFRVDRGGNVYGNSFNTSGADYAEFFEWKDQNIQDEDRCGLFVTLDGEYIRIANSNDKYILGVVSANPSVLGDAYNGDNWNGIYEKDIFGRIQYHTVHIEEEKDKNGVIIMEARDEVQPIISKNYNNQKAYYSREERTEWEPIGLLGKLIIIDDGTCEVNGYCKVADGGIGTKDDSETGYRVLSRLDENHIKILFR